MFRTGQKVVCVFGNMWTYRDRTIRTTTGWWLWKKTVETETPAPGPAKDEVCTVVAIRSDGYLSLAGYEQHGQYEPSCFRPVDDLEEQMKRIESEGDPVEQPTPQHA